MTPYEKGKSAAKVGDRYSPPYTREDQIEEYAKGYDDGKTDSTGD